MPHIFRSKSLLVFALFLSLSASRQAKADPVIPMALEIASAAAGCCEFTFSWTLRAGGWAVAWGQGAPPAAVLNVFNVSQGGGIFAASEAANATYATTLTGAAFAAIIAELAIIGVMIYEYRVASDVIAQNPDLAFLGMSNQEIEIFNDCVSLNIFSGNYWYCYGQLIGVVSPPTPPPPPPPLPDYVVSYSGAFSGTVGVRVQNGIVSSMSPGGPSLAGSIDDEFISGSANGGTCAFTGVADVFNDSGIGAWECMFAGGQVFQGQWTAARP